MSALELQAQIRTKAGKAEARRLRRSGQVPCVLYGVEDQSVKLTVNQKELTKILTGDHALIDLVVDGKSQSSVVKEIQYHPVKGNITHVDWLRVQAGVEITVSVPLKFVGSSAGVKAGGIFQELKAELEITCLPKNLPEFVEVDVSKLEIGDSIHVRDLKVGDITIRDDEDSTVCSIVLPKKIVEVEVEEEAEMEEGEEAEPEVISKAKSEEGETEG
jgi:large subunit ribosomal protein L25